MVKYRVNLTGVGLLYSVGAYTVRRTSGFCLTYSPSFRSSHYIMLGTVTFLRVFNPNRTTYSGNITVNIT